MTAPLPPLPKQRKYLPPLKIPARGDNFSPAGPITATSPLFPPISLFIIS